MPRIWYDKAVYVPLRVAADEDAITKLVQEIAALDAQEQTVVLEALYYETTKSDAVFKYVADRKLVDDVSEFWSFDTSPRGMIWVRMKKDARDELRDALGGYAVESEDEIPDVFKELGFVEGLESAGSVKKVKFTPAAQVLADMTQEQYDAFWELFVDNETEDKNVIELVAALGFADQVYTNREYARTDLGDALLQNEAIKKVLFGG